MNIRNALSASVQPIDFSKLSGRDFERLVFALLVRRWAWRQIDWIGQQGADGGQDIAGVRFEDLGEKRVVVLCANWRRLTKAKVKSDLNKASSTTPPPDSFIVVSGGPVTATLRQGIAKLVQKPVLVWSGPELEELLRFHAGSVLRRFFDGVPLPDEALDIRSFATEYPNADDLEKLNLLSGVFDRPAFYTPFRQESSLPAFRQALTDTIEVLNTGLLRARDGTLIKRLPSRDDFASSDHREAIASISRAVAQLRSGFDGHLRSGNIRPCGCGQPDCPVFTLSNEACGDLDQLRGVIEQQLLRLGLKAHVIRDQPTH
jgi:hypothetical protein